jgi:hypothetical protein
LNKYYHSKCAYCEMTCKADIEHYRPKKGVEEDPAHNGYYWLCYEWSNLIPSCRTCNAEGAKGTKFPVAGNRITGPSFLDGALNQQHCLAHEKPLSEEKPLLLHPEIDNPKIFLAFEPDPEKKGVGIKGIDAGGRGSETIRICALDKPHVSISRIQDALYFFIQSIDTRFKEIENGILPVDNFPKAIKQTFLQAVDNAGNEKMQHTLLWWYVTNSAEAFEAVVVPMITIENQREIVVEYFREFKAGNL